MMQAMQTIFPSAVGLALANQTGGLVFLAVKFGANQAQLIMKNHFQYIFKKTASFLLFFL